MAAHSPTPAAPLNRRVFDEQHGHAWIKHNIEEVGLFEALLPRLYPGIAAHDETPLGARDRLVA